MNLSITGKQFELTDSIKNYVESAFENLNKYGLDIISGRCVISADERNGKKGFIVDFLINLAKKDTIVIRHKDKDLYAAIDSITNRASKILRRTHDKNTTHKNKDDKISKEFYYLGRMYATGEVKEFIMPNTDKSAVEIEWALDTPVREDIYEYIING